MSGPADAWPRPGGEDLISASRWPTSLHRPTTRRTPSRNMLLHLTARILVDREKAEASGLPGYTSASGCRLQHIGDARSPGSSARMREAKLRRRACPGSLSLPSRRWLASSELLPRKAQWIVMPYTRVLWRRSTKRKLEALKQTGLLTCTVSLSERTTPAARVMSSMLATFSISSTSGAGD